MSKDGSINRRALLSGAALGVLGASGVDGAAAQPPIMPDLTGTSILITGASSGFGRLGAEYYARLGAHVIASMRNLPRDEAAQLAALAASEKVKIDIVEIDVLSDASVRDGVNAALKAAGGKIDVLINNAGIGITGPVEAQDMRATQLAFNTNVFGCQRMIRAVLPSMRARKSGLIVPISSQIGRLVVPGAGHYCATKFALEAMSEQMAYELVPHQIDVSIIQPGGYPTKIWVNRNRYTSELKSRLPEEMITGYGPLTASMGQEDGSRRTADPMDVPREIAQIIAMPAGARPLRRAVHPGPKPQARVNAAMREAQLAFLGATPFGDWVRAAQN